jgi:hypothetical protein
MTIPFDTHYWEAHQIYNNKFVSNKFICTICGLVAWGHEYPIYPITRDIYDRWSMNTCKEYELTCDEILIRNIIE